MIPLFSRPVLYGLDFTDCGLQFRSHQLVHGLRVMAFHEIRFVPVPSEQTCEFFIAHTPQNCRVRDLVSVQVKNRQDCSIPCRVQELVRMPTRGQRPGLRLSISHYTTDQKVRIIKGCAIGMRNAVTEFSSLMNGSRRLRRHMARDSARKRKLLEQTFHAELVLPNIRVDFAVRAFQVSVRHQARPAMTRTRDVNHIQVEFLDQTIAMHINEIKARRGTPVAEEPRLHMLYFQRLSQQRVVVQINLPYRQVVGGAPVRIHPAQFVLSQRLGFGECSRDG